MDILKLAIEWAKDEIFSSKFFILFGVLFFVGTIAFRQLGKTDLAKAFVIPTVVAGILLLIVGFGLLYSNKTRLKNFPTAYKNDTTAFVTSEINRAEKTVKEYKTAVFRVIPIIIVVCALLLMFVNKPLWRAISITTIAMMIVIVCIDSNASARIEAYKKQLETVEK